MLGWVAVAPPLPPSTAVRRCAAAGREHDCRERGERHRSADGERLCSVRSPAPSPRWRAFNGIVGTRGTSMQRPPSQCSLSPLPTMSWSRAVCTAFVIRYDVATSLVETLSALGALDDAATRAVREHCEDLWSSDELCARQLGPAVLVCTGRGMYTRTRRLPACILPRLVAALSLRSQVRSSTLLRCQRYPKPQLPARAQMWRARKMQRRHSRPATRVLCCAHALPRSCQLQRLRVWLPAKLAATTMRKRERVGPRRQRTR